MNLKEQAILAKNDPWESYKYCKRNEDANISLHEDVIIKSDNVGYNYYFAKYIKKSNKERLFKRLLELNNLTYIKEFLENVDFDRNQFEDLLLFI